MSKGTTPKWRRFMPGQHRVTMVDAHAIIQVSCAGARQVKLELERIWNLLQLMADSEGEVRRGDLQRYGGALEAIDRAIAEANYKGLSLIDGSGYSLDLRSGWFGRSQQTVHHHNLGLGPKGLNLPTIDQLDGMQNMSDAGKEAKEAIEKTEAVIEELETELGALAEEQNQFTSSMEEAADQGEENAVKEIAQIVVIALVIALIVRSFFFQFFNIPSGSMKSTLLIGDFVFVSKYAYGYSHKSFPLGIDFFEGRILERSPKRGDVVVFKQTADGRTDYIKRIVGLPGDTVQMVDGVLLINGIEVKKEPDGSFIDDDPRNDFPAKDIARFKEYLPGGVQHTTLDEEQNGRFDNSDDFVVPEGHFFVMGDNRDNSADSRLVGGAVEFVPAEYLVGRAEMVFFSVNGQAKFWEVWKWPSAIRYERLFKKIE